MLDREQKLELVGLAGRAPSAHNIQPARWRFSDNTVELWEDPSRWLSVGDATGRDNRIAMGMAWEGMAIALSRLGLRFSREELLEHSPPPLAQPHLVATGSLGEGASPDCLADALEHRFSWRGMFAPATPAQVAALDACTSAHAPLAGGLPGAATAAVAKWFDWSAAEALDSPPFARELYSWMRFSPRAANWTRDGLAADCMALSRFEAAAASWLLKPVAVRVLAALSLTRFVIAESKKTLSAARIVTISRAQQQDPFDAGRAWYRYWLALDAAGFAAVPMSALADSHAESRRLLQAWPLPPGRELLNLMRCGPAPPAAPRSARLPAAELLLAPRAV